MNNNALILALLGEEMAYLDFEELPILEANADTDTFVCEFLGGGSTNETGTGAGLSGADLVLTQGGGVPGSSGGWRDLNTDDYFSCTDNFLDTFLRNASGFSMLWHMRNADFSGGTYLALLSGTLNGKAYSLSASATTSAAVDMRVVEVFGGATTTYANDITVVFPSAGEFWVLMSADYTNELCFCGVAVGTSQPTAIEDFVVRYIMTDGISVPSAPLSSTRSSIVGHDNSSGAAFGIKSVTVKKGPSVTLSA